MLSGLFGAKPVAPRVAGLQQLLHERPNTLTDQLPPSTSFRAGESLGRSSPVWEPVVKVAMKVATMGVGHQSAKRLFTGARQYDSDDKTRQSTNSSSPATSTWIASSLPVPVLSSSRADDAWTDGSPRQLAAVPQLHRPHPRSLPAAPRSTAAPRRTADQTTPHHRCAHLAAVYAATAAFNAASTAASHPNDLPIVIPHGIVDRTVVPAPHDETRRFMQDAAAQSPVVGSVLSAYVYAFFGCAGLAVPRVNVCAGGHFTYNFRIVNSTGMAIDVTEHTAALQALRLLSVPGGNIRAGAHGHTPAMFTPRVTEVRHGRFGTRNPASWIKVDGRVVKGVDQGDAIAAIFAHATGLAGARVMHVVNDHMEGTVNQHFCILAAPRGLLDDDPAARRKLVVEHRPHAVLAIDDVEQVVWLKPGDSLKVGNAVLQVSSTERVPVTATATNTPPVFVIRAFVVGDDTHVLSLGDIALRAASLY